MFNKYDKIQKIQRQSDMGPLAFYLYLQVMKWNLDVRQSTTWTVSANYKDPAVRGNRLIKT